MALMIRSPAFAENGTIPTKFTCEGDDISPALSWQGAPTNTKSFVLIMDDPDAPVGIWDHWLLFNIPANTNSLPENLSSLPSGTQIGKNSWNKASYGGPCPPDGEHRYFFKLYALDTKLNLSNPQKDEIESAMQGHILATATLMGKYVKKH